MGQRGYDNESFLFSRLVLQLGIMDVEKKATRMIVVFCFQVCALFLEGCNVGRETTVVGYISNYARTS